MEKSSQSKNDSSLREFGGRNLEILFEKNQSRFPRTAGLRDMTVAIMTILLLVTADSAFSQQVATPAMTPAEKTSAVAIEVEISCATPDAVIYYTTDGTDPVVGEDFYYEPGSKIYIYRNTILKAIAADTSGALSSVKEAEYSLKPKIAVGSDLAPFGPPSTFLESDGAVFWNTLRTTETMPVSLKRVEDPASIVIDNAIDISMGSMAGFVVDNQGFVWSYGDNSFGLLADNLISYAFRNTADRVLKGVSVPGDYLSDIVQVQVGNKNVYALSATEGSIFSWGTSRYGALGNGSGTAESDVWTKTASESVTRKDTGLVLKNIEEISASNSVAFARDSFGKVWGWGLNTRGILGIGAYSAGDFESRAIKVQIGFAGGDLTDVTNISASSGHCAAVRWSPTELGTVWCWGAADYGKLGNGVSSGDSVYPTKVQKMANRGGGFLDGIVQVAAGNIYTLALDQDGIVWGWGGNNYGSLGDGTTISRNKADVVEIPNGVNIVSIATGSQGAGFAIAENGDKYGWGTYNPTTGFGSKVFGIPGQGVKLFPELLNTLPQIETVSVPPSITGPSNVTVEIVAEDSDDGIISKMDVIVGATVVATTSGTNSVSASWFANGLPGKLPYTVRVTDGFGGVATYSKSIVVLPPSVSVAKLGLDSRENEGGSPVSGTFRILRTYSGANPPAAPLTVKYSVGGTAVGGVDYLALTGSATIPSGVAYVDIAVVPISDTIEEEDETVILTILPSIAYAADGNATLSIIDSPQDNDENGLDDSWETNHFGQIGVDPNADPDNDGFTNQQEYSGGSNPTSYYSRPSGQLSVALSKIGGDGQLGEAGEYLSHPLQVRVKDLEGSNLVAAPVTFTVLEGGGKIASELNFATSETEIIVQTDSNGIAEVYYKQAAGSPVDSRIRVSAGSEVSLEFVEYSTANDGDTDEDGMPDEYEIANGFNRFADDAFEDPDGDRIPNLFEYKHGWKATVAGRDPDSGNPVALPPTVYKVDATFNQDDPSSNEYRTIQSALDAASQSEEVEGVPVFRNRYAVIDVKGGVYQEQLVLDDVEVLLLGELGSANGPATIAANPTGVSYVLTVRSSTILDGFVITHQPGSAGGGIHVEGSGTTPFVRLVNTIIRGNTGAAKGGGVLNESGAVELLHCTIVGNSALADANAICSESGTVSMLNSIVWSDNGAAAKEIHPSGSPTIQVGSSIVKGGEYGGLNVDPILGADGLLRAGSPAVDAGDSLPLPLIDINGELRSSGAAPDLGADEFLDSDSDMIPDWLEALGIEDGAADFDTDGMSNGYELAMGLNPIIDDGNGDLDGDGVPNREDARPANASVGRLNAVITAPANGSIVP